MALEITDFYTDLLAKFFSLSDDGVTLSPSTPLPPWLPTYCNSLTDAHFLSNIINIVSETSNDTNQVITEILQTQETNGLKTLLENMRWRFGDLLSRVWKNGKMKLARNTTSL